MFKTLAHTPALALATAGYLKALLSDGALPGFYKELIAMRLSVLLSSEYAVTAHAFSARQKGATEAQISAARADFESGPFTSADKLGCRAAERLHRSAAEINDAFFSDLKRTSAIRKLSSSSQPQLCSNCSPFCGRPANSRHAGPDG
jgi:AhpD family alkylhydroperoxidase